MKHDLNFQNSWIKLVKTIHYLHMGDYKDLLVYKKGYVLAMQIFEVSKKFPEQEQ